MNLRGRYLRAAVTGPLVALLLQLGVVVPLLERTDAFTGPQVESEHGSDHCPTPHDHTICTQVGANQAVAIVPASGPAQSSSPDALAPMRDGEFARGFYALGAPARAPPSV
jgi:hypothetical protein